MGDNVNKEQKHTAEEVKNLQYKGEPMGDDLINYVMPEENMRPENYYPEELVILKEFNDLANKVDVNGFNDKFAKKLFEPVNFKRIKLVSGTEDNPKYVTDNISLSADETIKYINDNNKTDFFREVTRNGNEGFHLVAFCESKGMSVQDMEYALDNPDTEKGRRINEEMDKYRVELYEMLCCDDPIKKEEQFKNFYADYVECQTKMVAEYVKKGDVKFSDMEDMLKHTAGYQSLLLQTLNLGTNNEARKAKAEAFVKKVDEELKNRGSEAKFLGLTPIVSLAGPFSQCVSEVEKSVATGEFLNDTVQFRRDTRGQIVYALMSYNSLRTYIQSLDKDNPIKSLAQITEEKAQEIAGDIYESQLIDFGFDTDHDEGRIFLADSASELISQKTGVKVTESQARNVMNDSLVQFYNMVNDFDQNSKYASIINDIAKAGKNFESKDGIEKLNATRDLKLMTSLLLEEIDENDKDIGKLKDCCSNILVSAKVVEKSIALSVQGIDVIEKEDAPEYNAANRMLEANFLDRMQASQKKIFGKSSEQFTNMENALKEYNEFVKNLGSNPTPEETDKIRQQLLNIKKLSKDYLDIKENKKLTKNGQERLQIAKEVNSYFDKAYVNSLDTAIENLIKNPNIEYGGKELPDKLMMGALRQLNNAALRTAFNDFGGKESYLDNIELCLKGAKSVDEFKEKIIADKGISDKELYLNNAGLFYLCHQKDLKDAPIRKSRAKEMLNNAKYPKADREALTEFARKNDLNVKDPSGDDKYLSDVEKLRQFRINTAYDFIYTEFEGSQRWAHTLLMKPGLKDEEREFIASEISKPRTERTKLYEYALNEIKNCNMNSFNDKSMDELIDNFPEENYYRLLMWDKDSMFSEMDEAIQKKNLFIEESGYKQIKQFATAANGNASIISSKIYLYERNQSMILDPSGKKYEELIGAMATADSSTRSYLVEQGSYVTTLEAFTDRDTLEHKKAQMDIALDPSCIRDKLAEQSKKYWDKCRANFEKMNDNNLSPEEKKRNLIEIIDNGAHVMYYNSAKLSAEHLTPEAAINILDPKNRESKLPDLRKVIKDKVQTVTMDKLRETVFRDEVNMKDAYEMRTNLGIHMQEKEAKKAEEKALAEQKIKDAREKKNIAQEKNVDKGNIIS